MPAIVHSTGNAGEGKNAAVPGASWSLTVYKYVQCHDWGNGATRSFIRKERSEKTSGGNDL